MLGLILGFQIFLSLLLLQAAAHRPHGLLLRGGAFLAFVFLAALSIYQSLPSPPIQVVITEPVPASPQSALINCNPPAAAYPFIESVQRYARQHNLQAIINATGQSFDATCLVLSIIQQESTFNEQAIGAAWDCGPMQVVANENRDFPNRPSCAQLLNKETGIEWGIKILAANIQRLRSVQGGLTAYNGSPTYPPIIFEHYKRMIGQVSSSSSQTIFPVPGGQMTQSYHGSHPGWDIGAPLGTPIMAAAGGIVQYVGPLYQGNTCTALWQLGPYGIVINHGGGTYTVYGHNASATVQAGQPVQAGQQIGTIGSLGCSSGPHLHFEVRIGETWNNKPAWPWQQKYQAAINPSALYRK